MKSDLIASSAAEDWKTGSKAALKHSFDLFSRTKVNIGFFFLLDLMHRFVKDSFQQEIFP